MKKSLNMNRFTATAIVIMLFSFTGLFAEKFSFVYMTDIHVQPGVGEDGFKKAVAVVNKLAPTFVITGGDLVRDVSHASYERAVAQYDVYTQIVKGLKMPVYNTIGNHDIFGLSGNVEKSHPEYGKKMFEKRIGMRFYSFNHEGWHFIVLDAVGISNGSYVGYVDKEQLKWLREDLSSIGKTTPIVLSVHIPFNRGVPALYTTIIQARGREDKTFIRNTDEVLDIFSGYNLKLVLSGHVHIYYTVNSGGTDFVSAGSIAGRWWRGPMLGTEEGVLQVNIENGNATWKYLDYGWNAGK